MALHSKVVCVSTPEELDRIESAETVFALTLWVEKEAKKKGIKFISAEAYVPQGETLQELSLRAQNISHNWYRVAGETPFMHKSLSLGETIEPMLEFYLGRLLYLIHTLDAFLHDHPEITHITLPSEHYQTAASAGVFAGFEPMVLKDTLAAVGKKYRNISITISEEVAPMPELFPTSKARLLLALYHACISAFPRRKNRVFVSDYWSHIDSAAAHLPQTDFIFMERSELGRIPLWKLVKHHVRFRHPLDHINKSDKETGESARDRMREEWNNFDQELRGKDWFTYHDVSLYEPVRAALTFALEQYSMRFVAEYEALARILTKEQVEKILLRASIGGRQHHFFLLTRVGEELGIPSIEIQHANEVVDPRTIHSHLAADYLAAYGLQTREALMQNYKYEPDRIRVIGSPRFDSYVHISRPDTEERKKRLEAIGLSSEYPVALVGIPAELADVYIVHFDSYAVRNMLQELKEVQKSIIGLQYVFKFRPGNLNDPYRELVKEFFEENVYLAEYENAFELMQISDVLLAGNSTLLYEGVASGTPTLMYPLRSHDTYTKQVYGKWVPDVNSPSKLRTLIHAVITSSEQYIQIKDSQRVFLDSKCSFDGKSGKRLAQVVEEDLRPCRAATF